MEEDMNFETFEDAVKWRKVHRKKLKTATRRQRRAARPLMRCRGGLRCETEACRICMRQFRLWWAGEAVKIMLQRPNWTRCSVIAKDLLVPYRQLSTFDLTAAVKRIRKRLQRSAIHDRIVLGGVDVSLNLEKNKIIGWQFHLYLLIEGKNDNDLSGTGSIRGIHLVGAVQAAVDVKSLHAKIGELTLENDFLEGALTKAGLLSAKR
jgi:hypothetical protein